nr:hypothetical protein [Tanacetum cinerariifolium]
MSPKTVHVVMKHVQSMSSSLNLVRRYGNLASGYESYMLVAQKVSSLRSTGDGMDSEAGNGGSRDNGNGNDIGTGGGKYSDDGGGGSSGEGIYVMKHVQSMSSSLNLVRRYGNLASGELSHSSIDPLEDRQCYLLNSLCWVHPNIPNAIANLLSSLASNLGIHRADEPIVCFMTSYSGVSGDGGEMGKAKSLSTSASDGNASSVSNASVSSDGTRYAGYSCS